MRPAGRLLAAAIVLAPLSAAALDCENPSAAAQMATPAGVDERLEIRLEEGPVLKMTGIEPPRASALAPGRPKDIARELSNWLAGRQLLFEPVDAPDRWGRTPARIFLVNDQGAVSLELALISGGLAQTALARGPCADALRQSEAAARSAGLGLWADPAFFPVSPARPEDFVPRAGALILVEGKVFSVGRVAQRLYLNLSAKRGALSATISKRNWPKFEKAGLAPAALVGKMVRLRGLAEVRLSPQIELYRPDQIEILNLKDASAPAGAMDSPLQSPLVDAPRPDSQGPD